MAGGGSHPKSSSHRPPSSSSHRKSRWEPPTTTTTTNSTNPQSGPKPPKPNAAPSPKPTVISTVSTNTNTAAATTTTSAIEPTRSPFLDLGPPPPPTYGFHMLERRTIVLADGSVRSYLALPPDYQDFPMRPPLPPHLTRFPHMGPTPDFPGGPRFPPRSPEGLTLGLGFRDNNQSQNQNPSMKRKQSGGEEDFKYGNNPNGLYRPDYRSDFLAGTSSSPFRRDTGDELRAGKYMRIGGGFGDSVGVGAITKHLEVDQKELKKAFLHFAKVINETEGERRRYLEDGKLGRIHCVACARSSKDFPDTHALIMHTYNSDNAELRVDHLGLHKALCVLMGWNYSKPPDNSKAYQFLPADEAAANQDDLIMWPPMVIIHNTITGKGKDGRLEGLGNRAMDSKIRDLGFMGCKSKSLYGREGHLGVTLMRFSGDQSSLKEALRLAEYFEKENQGRKAWSHLQPVTLGKDDEKNPNLVKVDQSGEKKRIFYGYIGTVADLHKVDFETRKKVVIESQREYRASK